MSKIARVYNYFIRIGRTERGPAGEQTTLRTVPIVWNLPKVKIPKRYFQLEFVETSRTMIVVASSMRTRVHERRATTRLVSHCDAEVITSLTILDNDAAESDERLVFSGRISDLSLGGLGIVLPSAPIDERFCTDRHQITVRIFPPHGPIQLQLIPSRCVSIRSPAFNKGYLLAGKIISSEEQYSDYLNTLSPRDE